MTEKNTTTRKSLLNDRAFKIFGYISLILLIIILLSPVFPSFPYKNKVFYVITYIFFFSFGDWFVTFLQHRSVAVISIIGGYVLAIIISVLLMFYVSAI